MIPSYYDLLPEIKAIFFFFFFFFHTISKQLGPVKINALAKNMLAQEFVFGGKKNQTKHKMSFL